MKIVHIPIIVEDYFGNDNLAFMLEIKSNGTAEVVQTQKCSLADVDGDYIFGTNNELFRIQSDEYPISSGSKWKDYLNYLLDWIEDHEDDVYAGCVPATYQEWQDCENEEDEDE